jgi:hypothetical protein
MMSRHLHRISAQPNLLRMRVGQPRAKILISAHGRSGSTELAVVS